MDENLKQTEEGYGAVISAFIVLTMLIVGFAWVASREFAERAQTENKSRESVRSINLSAEQVVDVDSGASFFREMYQRFTE